MGLVIENIDKRQVMTPADLEIVEVVRRRNFHRAGALFRIGKTAILPLVGRRIPIIGDDYADPEKGTGAVKNYAGAQLQRFRGRPAS